MVNIVNNHIGDQKNSGIRVTHTLLNENSLAVSGSGVPETTNMKGTKIAFLGFNSIFPSTEGILCADTEAIKQGLRETSSENDFAVVSFHWQNEYQSSPTTKQIELARITIDAGANLVIGHHPIEFSHLRFTEEK